ncbi:hypothetical protein QTN47_00950 [Danxiaibacter flavus]|uniref:Uncharacterized protein n=1 Tax=Danxiaibacter flavus TaxID=3049108 RepID=A0ABV3Z848_9BACT|nr:hypothetical protein QNM32_00950 [Chitinophagaceae bacterium DXS]
MKLETGVTMSINRQNYEEYFLMYIDDELSIHQRMEVEWFVQQNPDLANELSLLQQACLHPDEDIKFHDKQSLLDVTNKGINASNYEEYMLSYVDNELDEADKKSVEKFVLQNPQLQAQFSLLQKVVLEPEEIVFEHKEKLYRHSKKRVIPITFLRIAAAAAILIACAGIWMVVGKKDTSLTNHDITKVQPRVAPKEETQPIKQPGTIKELQNEGTKKDEVAQTASPTDNQSTAKRNTEENINRIKQAPEVKQEQTASNEPYRSQTANNNVNDEPVIAHNKPAETQQPELIVNKDAAPVKAVTASLPTDEPIVYKELDTDDANTRTVYVGSMQLNKTKIKGFFKKASRLFNKPQDEDSDGKLQIANFEIEKETK